MPASCELAGWNLGDVRWPDTTPAQVKSRVQILGAQVRVEREETMTDRHTMSTDEMLAAVDKIEHERGIYSGAEAYDLLLGLRDEVARLNGDLERLRDVLATIENDVRVASGELMVEMPRPGSPMARVMVANALMRRERDRANAKLGDVRALAAEWRAGKGLVNAGFAAALEAALKGEP